MKLKRILFIFLCLLCLMHIQPVHAETGYQAVLDDRADLLTDAEEKLLLQQMRHEVQRQVGSQDSHQFSLLVVNGVHIGYQGSLAVRIVKEWL